MAKKVVVISLGGSVIIPNGINIIVLREFKKVVLKNTKKYKFIIVCGGGKTARNYMNGLKDEKIRNKELLQCLLGIAITRLNARFMIYFFTKKLNQEMPNDMESVERLLKSNDVVFCGGLKYGKNETSDSTAAKIATHFDTDFINITDVNGLYDKDPKKHRTARFITEISHGDFYKMFKKIKFYPGQHFILDKKSARIIKKYNTTTYILGEDMENLDNVLNKKPFVGTVISTNKFLKK